MWQTMSLGFNSETLAVESLQSLPLYAEEGKSNLVIAIGCTGGHHRSVAVTHALAGFVRKLGYPVSETHRDMLR